MRTLSLILILLTACGDAAESGDQFGPECDVCEAFIPGSYPVYGPDGKLYCQPMWDCETDADCEEGATCSDGWCSIGVCG